MKSKALIIAIIILLVIAQATFINYFSFFNVKPDLVLTALVLLSLTLELRWVVALGLIAGVALDLLGALPFGFNTLSLPLFAFAVNKLSRRIDIDSQFMKIFCVIITVVAKNLLFLLFFVISGLEISLGIFLRILFISAIYTGAVVFLLARGIRLFTFIENIQ